MLQLKWVFGFKRGWPRLTRNAPEVGIVKSLLDFHTSEHWDAVGLAGEMVIHPISGSKSHQRSNPVSVDRRRLLGQGCRGCCTNTRSVQVFPSVSTRPGHCSPHTTVQHNSYTVAQHPTRRKHPIRDRYREAISISRLRVP